MCCACWGFKGALIRQSVHKLHFFLRSISSKDVAPTKTGARPTVRHDSPNTCPRSLAAFPALHQPWLKAELRALAWPSDSALHVAIRGAVQGGGRPPGGRLCPGGALRRPAGGVHGGLHRWPGCGAGAQTAGGCGARRLPAALLQWSQPSSCSSIGERCALPLASHKPLNPPTCAGHGDGAPHLLRHPRAGPRGRRAGRGVCLRAGGAGGRQVAAVCAGVSFVPLPACTLLPLPAPPPSSVACHSCSPVLAQQRATGSWPARKGSRRRS